MSRANRKQLSSIRSTTTLGNRDASILNIFTPPSTSSSEVLRRTGYSKGVSANDNRKLVYEIIDRIFDDSGGQCEVSSSQCSSVQNGTSEYSFDKRLRYWKNMVEERKRIAEFIKRKTGKSKDNVLFNRATTVDDRDKKTVKRLLDYAERMNPLTLCVKQEARLKEYVDTETCVCVKELRETLPQAERDGGTIVEISGLPNVAKEEQLGRCKDAEKPSRWLKSKVLEQRIGERREDIERVIEYYPDIDHLQVIGESLAHHHTYEHNADIMLVREEPITVISAETSECAEKCKPAAKDAEEEIADYGVKVNEHVFKLPAKRSSKNVEIEKIFECEPFQWVVRRVLHLENIGRKILNFEWAHRSFYDKTPTLLKAQDDEFVFNRRPFRLAPGEVLDVYVQYQPRTVQIVKEKWLLKINPPFFCRRQDSVVMLLSGRCKPPLEYVDKLNETQHSVIEKSNLKMMRKLTTNLASLTPLIKPNEVVCPYRRALNDRELFELYNVGYQCERFHDLELLKEIFKRVKKPCEPVWDLKLDSLKATILRLESPDMRALVFAEMMGVLEEMKGTPIELEQKMEDKTERDRSRLLFVRGIVATGIDDWEELTLVIEKAFLKPALDDYYAVLAAEEEGVMEQQEEHVMSVLLLDDDSIRKHVLKKMRRGKAFRDSLYIQTYTHLCNFIEDIVSVIESTEIE